MTNKITVENMKIVMRYEKADWNERMGYNEKDINKYWDEMRALQLTEQEYETLYKLGKEEEAKKRGY